MSLRHPATNAKATAVTKPARRVHFIAISSTVRPPHTFAPTTKSTPELDKVAANHGFSGRQSGQSPGDGLPGGVFVGSAHRRRGVALRPLCFLLALEYESQSAIPPACTLFPPIGSTTRPALI